MVDALILFTAGAIGGMLNSIAGGGSFVTFPALIMAGLSPVTANATNTFASFAGYVSGAFAFKEDIKKVQKLWYIVLMSSLGGCIGAYLLLKISNEAFNRFIPWLLLLATFLFVFGSKVNARVMRMNINSRYGYIGGVFSGVLLLVVCVYGGFFNAGLGIIILSYLAVVGYADIHTMNGIKLLVSSFVSICAVFVFIADDKIAWFEGTLVLVGSLAGGYLSARLAKKLDQSHVRNFVIVLSTVITAYFFYDVYFTER